MENNKMNWESIDGAKPRWVVYGAGYAGKAAFLILNGAVDYFIDNDKTKQNSLIEGIPVLSLEEGKKHLCGRSVVTGATNPITEKEMQNSLLGSETERIVSISELLSFSDLSHLGRCSQYDYAEILEAILKEGRKEGTLLSEYLFHVETWTNRSSKFFVEPIIKMCEKYRLQGCQLADVACGYGFWSLLFATQRLKVLGIDYDASRIDIFRRISKKYCDMTAITADIRNMEQIADGTQDVAFCASTIHVVSDWRKIILEMNRITRSQGLLILLITNLDNMYIKNLYRDLPVIQWDATCENIIQTVELGAKLVESIDVYMDDDSKLSDVPPNSLLVFSRL